MRYFTFLFVIAFLLKINQGTAQEILKIGHVNIPEIVQQMPETDSIQSVMKKETEEMEKMYGELITEHETNLKKFETEKDTYTDFVRDSKETDLMEMAAKIQQFQQTANQQLQKRNMELLQPIYAKINEAIELVAMKNNFTYILDLSNGTVVYNSPASQDLNPLVLSALKIQSH